MPELAPAADATDPHLAPGAVVLGRFRCNRLLKTGNGVDTYAATDLEAEKPVVLKRVAATSVDHALRLRLEHEADVLRRLEDDSHRSSVTMALDRDFMYLVTPYVPGITLEERLANGPLSVASAIRVGIDVLTRLEQAHDQGVLHRDVKPANVIVDRREPIGRAVLIDFGFARSSSLDVSLRDERVGTARYLAPEAAGSLGSAVDERSDLYSAGVLLFEALAGRPPFEGDDVGSVLRQHLNTPAPSLRGLGISLPRVLDAIVQRLLRKDPAERYQTPGAVIRDLEAVAEGLARGVADPAVVIGLHDRRQALAEPSFVGREVELGRLEGLIRRAALGRGGLVLVEAESGGGKSRLLEELRQQTQARSWVLQGGAVDQAAKRPFQLLEGVVAGILASHGNDPTGAALLRERLGDRAEAVVATLPELAGVLGEADAAHLGPEAYGETRSIAALSSLLDALGSEGRPAVVILDDCQWADGPTLRLLVHWQERAKQHGSHVVVIGAYRSEEVGPHHLLRSVDSVATMVLPPFGDGDVRALVESMAGPLPKEVVATVAALSEGSPFMAAAVLRGLLEAGAITDTDSGWHVDGERLAHVQTSRRAALFLLQRLELLSAPTLEVLSAAAVLGKEFSVPMTGRLCAQDEDTVAHALAEASRRRIVWVEGEKGSFLHDKLREALLSRLTDDDRRDLHRRAASELEATDGGAVFELAYHFNAAGMGAKTVPYALEAAQLARTHYSLDVAAAHYRMAEAALARDDLATRAVVAEALGDVLTLRGAYDEATAALEEARSLAQTNFQRASLDGKLGDVAFKRGEQGLARRHLESALRQLNRRLPRRGIGFLFAALVEIVVQAAHTLAPRLFLARRTLDSSENEFLAIRIYSRLAYVYWFSAGRIPCAWAHFREMNLAERYPPTPELAQAYSEHAPVMTMVPWTGRGIEYARRSLIIRREQGDVWGQGQSLHFYGVVLYAATRYRESIEKCQEAVRLLDRTGDRWEVNTATWHIAYAHYRLGELDQAASIARNLHAAALEINDDAAAGISLSAWSKASGGRVPAELVADQLAQQNDDAHTGAEVHVAEGVRLLHDGLLDDAIATFEAAADIVRKAGLRQEYIAPVLPWLATALRMKLETLPAYATPQRRQLVRRARRVARQAWRIARYYRNNAPHALRERGLIAALDGKVRRARRLLDQSQFHAERQDALYELALTRRAWGDVGQSLGWQTAEQVKVEADSELAALLPHEEQGGGEDSSGSPSLSLADRFATLLVVGHQIASAPSPHAVYSAVREAAVTLLRGERCHLLEVQQLASATTVSGENIDRLSQSLIARALEEGHPVVLAKNGSSGSGDSVVLSELRSALCAPIYCEGKPIACLYVTHSQVTGLFGPTEIQLTEFIATLAGAALDHVAGSEARFRSLAQNSSDVITIVGRTSVITYQSSAVKRVFGFEPTWLVDTSLSDWLHPDDRLRVLALLEQASRRGEPPRLIECRLRHNDGSWRDVEMAATNLLDDPSVEGLVLNSRDISDRKQAERELRETLQREQAMRESLQELDRIKTDFVSAVSHELRTPLSSILGYVEMLSDGDGGRLDHGQQRVLGIVERNARRLLILIEDLLTISRVESGTFRLSLGPVDVAGLVESAHQALLPTLVVRELDVVIEVDKSIGPILGDATQLDRVITNLLTNAIKFTPDGGRVMLKAARERDEVVLSVADTGIGIPYEEQPKIFERFFRSSSAQELAVPGTGLGLSITKKVIEEHQGDISLESTPGVGTTVTVRLPLAPQPVA